MAAKTMLSSLSRRRNILKIRDIDHALRLQNDERLHFFTARERVPISSGIYPRLNARN